MRADFTPFLTNIFGPDHKTLAISRRAGVSVEHCSHKSWSMVSSMIEVRVCVAGGGSAVWS